MNLKAAIMVMAILAGVAPTAAAAQEWRGGHGHGHGQGAAEHGWRGRGPDGAGPPGQRGRGGGYGPPGQRGRDEGYPFMPPGQRGRGYAPSPYGPPRVYAPVVPHDGWRGGDPESPRAYVRNRSHVPLGQALSAVRRRAAGRLLDAQMETSPDGRHVYRVRWATADGRRVDSIVDAETGAIIGEGR